MTLTESDLEHLEELLELEPDGFSVHRIGASNHFIYVYPSREPTEEQIQALANFLFDTISAEWKD